MRINSNYPSLKSLFEWLNKDSVIQWIKQIKSFFADFLIVFYISSQFSLLIYLFAKLLQHGK